MDVEASGLTVAVVAVVVGGIITGEVEGDPVVGGKAEREEEVVVVVVVVVAVVRKREGTNRPLLSRWTPWRRQRWKRGQRGSVLRLLLLEVGCLAGWLDGWLVDPVSQLWQIMTSLCCFLLFFPFPFVCHHRTLSETDGSGRSRMVN